MRSWRWRLGCVSKKIYNCVHGRGSSGDDVTVSAQLKTWKSSQLHQMSSSSSDLTSLLILLARFQIVSSLHCDVTQPRTPSLIQKGNFWLFIVRSGIKHRASTRKRENRNELNISWMEQRIEQFNCRSHYSSSTSIHFGRDQLTLMGKLLITSSARRCIAKKCFLLKISLRFVSLQKPFYSHDRCRMFRKELSRPTSTCCASKRPLTTAERCCHKAATAATRRPASKRPTDGRPKRIC